MIKKNFKVLLLSIAFTSIACAQAPNGYYDSAEGLEGYELKTALKNIIKNHSVLSYGSLNNLYNQIDKDIYFENDGSLLDVYSEKPNGPDAYNYGFGNGDQCGQYNSEADCWNKEHIFPQGFFNEQLPMRSDLHQVLPTDGYVNNRRGNYNFGKVGTASWTSTNGSKVGGNVFPGYSGTVFEPIDEFKGDIARIMFYFATRYEDQVTSSSWDSHTTQNNPLNGTKTQVYEDWIIDLFLEWHAQDPVSQKEIDRNNKVHQIQGNRNPFVDNPQWVYTIWAPEMATVEVQKSLVSVYPNPAKDKVTINADASIERYEVLNSGGQVVLIGKPNSKTTSINVQNLPKGVYIVKTTVNGVSSTEKLIKK